MASTPITQKLKATCLVALLTLAFAFVAPQVVATHDGTDRDHEFDTKKCFEKGASWASLGSVTANGVTLQTQLGGTTLELPRGLLAAAVSTTGHLEVTVDHQCVRAYNIVAVKTNALGTTTPLDHWQYPSCVPGTDTYQLPVGWDVVEYDIYLTWWGCDGSAGKDYVKIRVVDPPLPLDDFVLP